MSTLQRFRSSALPREQEVFACMVHNLFDEYKFFPRYPDKVSRGGREEWGGGQEGGAHKLRLT